MIITSFDMEKFTENPINFVQDMINKMEEAEDYTLKYYREPIDEGYPEIEGVSFILNEILGLKDPSTNNIASILKKYIDYINKYDISIIKEFDEHCDFAYTGQIPSFTTDYFTTQPFYGFNKFQILSAETLYRKPKEGEIYFRPIDFTYALDSNATSYFEKFYKNQDERYRKIFEMITGDGNNVALLPYIFEIIMQGFKNFGIRFKLNKRNKDSIQKGFFQNLKILHAAGLFKEKSEKEFINKIIKKFNLGIEVLAFSYYQANIFLILMLEARFKFKKSQKAIIYYVYKNLRELQIPIENKIKAILYIFSSNPNHGFFNKVINIINIKNIDKYMEKVNNTARDIALILMERFFYNNSNIFASLATGDKNLISLLHDIKPDFIIQYKNLYIPIYKRINEEMQKKYIEFFTINNTKEIINFKSKSLKEMDEIYIKKQKNFQALISNKI